MAMFDPSEWDDGNNFGVFVYISPSDLLNWYLVRKSYKLHQIDPSAIFSSKWLIIALCGLYKVLNYLIASNVSMFYKERELGLGFVLL